MLVGMVKKIILTDYIQFLNLNHI